MSRRHDIEARLEGLADIDRIMRSMKNLSYLETRKLARFMDAQRRVMASVEAAARDFLAHHPALLGALAGPAADAHTCWLLIGAERGFCGDFNEAVRHALDAAAGAEPRRVSLIAIGSRLALPLEQDPRLIATVPGASTAEEVGAVLARIIDTLDDIAACRHAVRLKVLHWDDDADAVRAVSLLPPFQDTVVGEAAPAPPKHAYPPLLNLRPAEFLERLVDHTLLAALQALLYSSLMAEHQHRLRHLDGALNRIEERTRTLTLRRNLWRQEEITEEIELILLNRPAAGH
ncbi:MAG: F0F1 ATP synthase subunit gamma [Thiohalocapsa sp.]|uniref:F0F1 ATP synthase subunit gamma n=1 Tax=Thiohalocapsa sp. TaxID=2497641 RepID=UPI0025F51476|nr:F0F1 ATP synthase subunit gamma [Thiohalocapsa sp.]MCG6942662.1 F0F1 ATP synthase subunit gamma [Thiohalocapsa sp.]